MTIYDSMKFPKYEFREYPKMVYPNGSGKDASGKLIPGVKVLNLDEERAALAGKAVVREEDERAALLIEIDAKGVKNVDRSWPVQRLREEIEEYDAALILARGARRRREEQSGEVVDEHARLIALAEANDVKIDKRWGDEKIVAALREAGIDESA